MRSAAIAHVSVVLYEPPANRRATGRKFIETVREFYPWDAEPLGAFNNAGESAEILYGSFRNPMAHAFGFQEPEPRWRPEHDAVSGARASRSGS